MYTNKCTKCGKEFETKNPKRVICPECLYPDRTPILQDPSAPSAPSAANAAQYPEATAPEQEMKADIKDLTKTRNARAKDLIFKNAITPLDKGAPDLIITDVRSAAQASPNRFL